MPQGEIPQNFRSNQPFLLPRILAIKKRGETLLPESSFLISTAKDWSCEGVFSIKLRSVISKTQFFDWGACKLMKPCEKRNCCLAQNYFSYQAISECWYFMDPCHTCHAEFGWKAAALKGPGSSTRLTCMKNMWLGYTRHQDGWGCTVVVHSRLEGRSERGMKFGGRLIPTWMTMNVAFLWIRRSVETLNTLSTMLCLKTNI